MRLFYSYALKDYGAQSDYISYQIALLYQIILFYFTETFNADLFCLKFSIFFIWSTVPMDSK